MLLNARMKHISLYPNAQKQNKTKQKSGNQSESHLCSSLKPLKEVMRTTVHKMITSVIVVLISTCTYSLIRSADALTVVSCTATSKKVSRSMLRVRRCE